MLHDSLLPLLRCPVTKLPLRKATAEEKLASGLRAEEEALISIDGTQLYRELNSLPVLLPMPVGLEA